MPGCACLLEAAHGGLLDEEEVAHSSRPGLSGGTPAATCTMRAKAVALAGATLRVLRRERARDGPRNVRRDVGVFGAGVGWLVAQMRPQDLHPLAIREWWLACEALEHDAAEGIHVGRRGHLLTADLLGRHVVERPDGLPRLGYQAGLQVLREAEVGNVRVAFLVKQDVRRLQVTMDHAVGVKRADSFCDLQAQRYGRLEVELALALELLLQGAAADEGLRHVGHTVVLPAVEDGHNVRMLYPGGALNLAGEAPPETCPPPPARAGRA